MIQVVAAYPGPAAKGACYLTAAALGEIVEDRGDGPIVRPERAIVTDTEIDYEGTLCLGEKVVRHMAHELEMVDGWRVDALKAEFEAVRTDRDRISTELAAAMVEGHRLSELLAGRPVVRLYVAIDGSEHESADAAISTTARLTGLRPRALVEARPVTADEAPDPMAELEEVPA